MSLVGADSTDVRSQTNEKYIEQMEKYILHTLTTYYKNYIHIE